MIVRDFNGNEFLELIDVSEDKVDELYSPVNHALLVVKAGEDYLMGYNHYRKDWEVFGGCREEKETIRECIARECKEELGIENAELTYIGLMKFNMAPGYFSPQRHIEFGGLYGLTIDESDLKTINTHRKDKKEIEKISLFKNIPKNDKVSEIDEKLLEYWN